jgi:hypothetical protein
MLPAQRISKRLMAPDGASMANLGEAVIELLRDDSKRPLPWRTIGCSLTVCLSVALGLILVRALIEARESAHQSACQGRLNQMQLAFLNYHERYGSFPPAYVADAAGKPMHSWRVLMLPFIDHVQVYDEYDFAEPWDGPHNRKLADRIYSDMFHCDSGPTMTT